MQVQLSGECVVEATHIAAQRWNGFLNPSFDRANAEKVVAYFDAEYAKDPDSTGGTHFVWEGEKLIMVDDQEHPPYDRTEVPRDADGNYAIGNYGWCWQEA